MSQREGYDTGGTADLSFHPMLGHKLPMFTLLGITNHPIKSVSIKSAVPWRKEGGGVMKQRAGGQASRR